MHPFGSNPPCPRCSKVVYAAEQAMGPGRKLYHKPCLTCTLCNKRLDSFTLLEHDQEPYCNLCHVKNFGTRDLRSGNLPHKDPLLTPSSSDTSSPPRRELRQQEQHSTPPPRLRYGTQPQNQTPTLIEEEETADDRFFGSTTRNSGQDADEEEVAASLIEQHPSSSPISRPTPSGERLTNTGRPGLGNIPRTIPLFSDGGLRTSSPISPSAITSRGNHHASQSLGGSIPLFNNSSSSGSPRPLTQTATGTRYGVALTRGGSGSSSGSGTLGMATTGGSPRKWGGESPTCPRCSKNVYFAEQVRALGKTWHKGCLRCTQCASTLDSSKLRDHDGDPFCVRCYGKLYGPEGSGYALLGKSGA